MTLLDQIKNLREEAKRQIIAAIKFHKEIKLASITDEDQENPEYDLQKVLFDLPTGEHVTKGGFYCECGIDKLSLTKKKKIEVIFHGIERGESSEEHDFQMDDLPTSTLCHIADLIAENDSKV